ncbi:SDR family oxidoreductase [Paenibacillus sp. N1-5-1-14]|uniref:SDR family NAD(P)-dependent oxidoreductase n=1 Tax=Paenibacillus radicibacter TaxID=2972488 RepID=UPI002159979B|nr:SDR family oxidoreductase [Paenibacillus radicibacter]MCR8643494.1 SDR family oxidoreductase [Paenibacillus radicibacter]
MNTHTNQVVMITGASKGLGRALALAFAKGGARLAICARGDEALQQVAAEIKQLGAEVVAIRGDAANQSDIERFVALVEAHYGHIDVLINNASIIGPSPIPYLLDYPEEDFAEVIRVNTIGPFLMTKRVLPGMLQRRKGSVINVTSEAGNTGYAGWGAYGISKFGIEGMTQTFADEVGEAGVRVNMVDPTEMNTQMHKLAVPDCDYELAEPEDVVDVFLYLASDESSTVNGQRFVASQFLEERGR